MGTRWNNSLAEKEMTMTNLSTSKGPHNIEVTQAPNSMSSELRIITLTLYAVIFLVSAVGNSLVCTVILRRKKMKTVTNYFVLNLAIADLTFTCICIPFDIPVQEMNYRWPYGAFLCKLLYPLQTLTLFASVYTLTAVSLSRFWAINHPLRRQLSTRSAKFIIVGIWIASLVAVTPYISVSEKNGESGKCDEEWPSKSARKTYTVTLFVFEYIFPLTVIAGAYISIGRELAHRARNGNRYLQDLQSEEAKKVVRMLKIVTLMFAVCVLPNNILWLWLDFGGADEKYDRFWDLVALGNIITFANSAANPICYTILNESYRNEFKDHLMKMFNKIIGKPSGGRRELLRMNDNGDSQRKLRTATMSSAF